MRRAALLALIALAACSKAGSAGNAVAGGNVASNAASNAVAAAPPAPPPAPSAALARIFTPDILGANLAFLETITGPAFKTEGRERLYKVDGCTVVVGTSRGKIDNLGIIDYSPRCSFDIAQYFAEGYDHPVPRTPTFGDIVQGLGGDWSADCLRLCGNAADPVATLHYQGSHADNFNDLVAQVSVNTDQTLAAWQDWSDKLTAKYGEAKVESGKFGADDILGDVAGRDFAAIRPTTIRVGSDLGTGAE